jgi:Helix-turn-helix domain
MATAKKDLNGNHPVQGRLLTVEQARVELGVSIATVYRYMANGDLAFSKQGPGRVINEAALQECKDGRKRLSERARMQRRAAAHSLHSLYDSRELTQPARDAFLHRFLEQVDPEGLLPRKERARRADQAKKAYFTDLARRSSKARGRLKSRSHTI